ALALVARRPRSARPGADRQGPRGEASVREDRGLAGGHSRNRALGVRAWLVALRSSPKRRNAPRVRGRRRLAGPPLPGAVTVSKPRVSPVRSMAVHSRPVAAGGIRVSADRAAPFARPHL